MSPLPLPRFKFDPTSLGRAAFLLFAISALLLILMQAVLQTYFAQQEADATTINLAGRQRMLSQRISKTALLLELAPDSAARGAALDEMRAAGALWHQTHLGLQQGDPQLGLPQHEDSPAVRQLFSRIEPHFQAMYAALNCLSAPNSDPRCADEPSSIRTILQNEDAFLTGMNEIVFIYSQEAQYRLDMARSISFIGSTIILLTGTLIGMRLLKPLIHRLQASYQQIEESRRMLQAEVEERRLTQARLQVAKEAAESANIAKTTFLASMSHEFRTPLNAIVGYADLNLLGINGSLKDEQRATLQRIKHNAADMLIFINQILELTRIESSRLEINNSTFEVRPWLTEIIQQYEVLATGKNLSLSGSVADELPAFLTGDSVRLKQILTNLLANAIKFTQQGQVSVHLGRKDADWLITVRDSGIGIPRDMQDRIFDDFVQVDTVPQAGTGIGLAIVRKLALLMDGGIKVESELDKGSTFTVHLPLTEPVAGP